MRSRLVPFLAVLLALPLTGCGDWAVLLPITPAGQKNAWFLISGIWYTILISLASIAIGSVIGLIGALMSRSRSRSARRAVLAYVEILRMIPLYVLLLWIYYGLPIAAQSLPQWVQDLPLLHPFVTMSAFTAAVTGLSLNAGAFLIEIFRAGIESVPRPQIDAAKSFGMSRWLAMRRIVLPQALRRMLPPTTSQFISIVKDSSLGAILGVMEITRRATLLQTQILHPLEIYTFLALEYVALLALLTALARHLERRFPQHS